MGQAYASVHDFSLQLGERLSTLSNGEILLCLMAVFGLGMLVDWLIFRRRR